MQRPPNTSKHLSPSQVPYTSCLEAFLLYTGSILFTDNREETMYLQEILEVAIGLVFVWLVLSLGTMSCAGMDWESSSICVAKDYGKSHYPNVEQPGYDQPLI